MIAKFEGGPYHDRTVEVHSRYVDFRAMGLMPVGRDVVTGSPCHHTHELVVGQYVVQEVLEGQPQLFKWDGPDVELPAWPYGSELVEDDPDTFVERRTHGDRRTGHTIGRRSFRSDRRQQKAHGVGWRESRRVEQRRKPKNQKQEGS